MFLNVVRDSHESEISKGLSHFQHNGEFVDMTIAVDGHMIKVHRNIIALASPYLREILKSVPSSHPVLFLNDISHDVFCSILEYIYMGTVLIDQDKVEKFMSVAQNLQIFGLSGDITRMTQNKNIILPNAQPVPEPPVTAPPEPILPKQKPVIKILKDIKLKKKRKNLITQCHPDTAPSSLLPTNMPMATTTQIPSIDCSNHDTNSMAELQTSRQETLPYTDQPMECTDLTTEPIEYNLSFDLNEESSMDLVKDLTNKLAPNTTSKMEAPEEMQIIYTLSDRGKLQMILNRFMYNMHHKANGDKHKRWRCLDYRRNNCQAYVDTVGDVVVGRKNPHKHPYHDEIIEEKAKKTKFFTLLTQAEMTLKEMGEKQTKNPDNEEKNEEQKKRDILNEFIIL